MTVLARARVILEGDTVQLTRSLQGATKAMEQAGRRMTSIGKAITTKVTLPIAAVGLGAIKAFSDFDDAMVQSIAIMGDVSDTLRTEMAAAAKEVARTTTTSATTAAESFFFLASAGLIAEQSIAALPQVAKFAQAGMFDMAQATDLATDAQSALGLTVKNAERNLVNLTRVTDVLVKANTLANATVGQFSEALTTEAGAALKTFNISIEEGVAVLAAFADQGIKGQIAGSSLSRILRLLTAAATKNKEEMEALGIAVFDDEEKIRKLADIIEDMEGAFGSMSDEMRTTKLEAIGFTARVQGIILPLLGTSKAIRKYEKDLEDAAGITDEIARKQLKSFAAQLKLTWNQIVLAANAAGEVLAPAITALSQKVRAASRTFEEFDEMTRRIIVTVVGLVAIIGPMTFALGAMTLGVAKLTLALKAMLVTAGGATRALLLLRAVASPGGALLVGLGLLAGLFIKNKIEAAKAAVSMKEANKEAQAFLGTFSPEKAAKTSAGLTRIIDRLSANVAEKNQEIENLLQDPRGFGAIGKAREARDLEIVNLDNAIEGLQRTITLLTNNRDIMDEIVEVGREAAEALEEALRAGETAAASAKLMESMTSLSTALDLVKNLAGLMGESFNRAGEEASALQSGILSLVEAGAKFDSVVGPNGETLQELIDRYEELTKEIEDAEKAQNALNDAEEEAKQIIASILTPLEAYNAKMAALDVHLKANRIDQEQFNRAAAQAQDILTETGRVAENFGATMQQVADSALDAFIRFTTTADASFREFADSVIRELARISAKLLATKLFSFLGDLGGTVGGPAAPSGAAHGGFVSAGSLAVVGEAGPEVIRAGRGGLTVKPMRGVQFEGQGAGSGGATINVTIQAVDARSFANLVEANPGAITGPLVRALGRSSALQGALFR